LFVLPGEQHDVDTSRGFTLRVALTPPLCGVSRDAGGVYELGLAMQPRQPGPFSLMTFSAFVSPPFADLFDFAWEVDGQAIAGASIPIVQQAASALPGGTTEHRVRVTAVGARPYPDPAQPSIPPTLAAECRFSLS